MLRSLTPSYNGQRRNTNHASYYVLILELTRLLRISYKLWAYAFHVRELHLYSSSLILHSAPKQDQEKKKFYTQNLSQRVSVTIVH